MKNPEALSKIDIQEHCKTFSSFTKAISVQVGRHHPESICDKLFQIQANRTVILFADGYPIDPPCTISLVGYTLQNKTFVDLCYVINEIRLPSNSNSSVIVKAWSLVVYENDTATYIRFNGSSPFREDTNEGFFTPFCGQDNDEAFLLEITIYIPIYYNKSLSKTSPFFKAKSRQDISLEYGESRPTIHYSGRVNEIILMRNYNICGCQGCPPCSEVVGKIVEIVKDEDYSKEKTIDYNNLITIMGGVVTSLFIPVVLLLVRHNIRNRSVKEQTGKRNPGDGSDDIDGKIDNNDAASEEDQHELCLLTPRQSMTSDELSFHSAY
ncbi:unnamed protein product [Mytilus coruscus]|uniref:Uncharacterized protein n=1 Tax=Mytilus coruscus TaxID=42192 RepID=A0A6J8EMB5_MYTCO|nr:unnamed protein product [Mytilus coruscus]